MVLQRIDHFPHVMVDRGTDQRFPIAKADDIGAVSDQEIRDLPVIMVDGYADGRLAIHFHGGVRAVLQKSIDLLLIVPGDRVK